MSNVYEQLMPDVVDAKDLGSGVIDGVECDYLAFRTEGGDWQIWIAQGDRPYPCRYVVTSKLVANGLQYSIQIRDWKTGDQVAADDFSFKNPTNAKSINLQELRDMDELPKHFVVGDTKGPYRSNCVSCYLPGSSPFADSNLENGLQSLVYPVSSRLLRPSSGVL